MWKKITLITLALVALGIFACAKVLKESSLEKAFSKDNPVLKLQVRYYRPDGTKLTSSGEALPTLAALLSTSDESAECPEVSGGDTNIKKPKRSPSWIDDVTTVSTATKPECELKATWNVFRHPVSASVAILNGDSVTDWLSENKGIQNFVSSPTGVGLSRNLLRALNTRAEDLQLTGLQGEFIKPLLREALSADAIVHYDYMRGSEGVTMQFNREKAPILGRALPIIVNALGVVAYKGEGSQEPIVQIRLGGIRLFLTQEDDTALISTGLTALLNILAQPEIFKEKAVLPHQNGSTVQITVRPDAFFEKFLSGLVGTSQWPIKVELNLSGSDSIVSSTTLPPARFFKVLGAKADDGVVAAIPHDVTTALVTSVKLPLSHLVKDWSIERAAEAASSGMALIWDLPSTPLQEGATSDGAAVGIAVVAPNAETLKLSQYVSGKALSTTCAGGRIWLAASTELLLTRMRESCDGQSPNALVSKFMASNGAELSLTSNQVSLMVNLEEFFLRTYLMGGGFDQSETKGEETEGVVPEQEARKVIADQVRRTLKSYGTTLLAGSVAVDQAGQRSSLRLDSFRKKLGTQVIEGGVK